MEIIWSKHAITRVEEIGDFIAQDSPARAKTFIEKLIDSTSQLKKFPFSGALMPENTIFRQLVFQSYRVIYRISEKRIEIVTVISPGLQRF